MSQYFKARRKRGACYGTLWKQHSSSIASIVTNSGGSSNVLSSMYNFDQVTVADYSNTNKNTSNSSSSYSSTSNSSTNNSTTIVSGGSRKETSVRNDYLNIINNNNPNANNDNNNNNSSKKKSIITVKGINNNSNNSNSNSSSNPHTALFKSKQNAKKALTAALEKNERSKCYEFCVLIGNTLTGYENLTAFRRGDHPISEVRIVGASAWNPSSHDSSSSSSLRSSTSAPSLSSVLSPSTSSSSTHATTSNNNAATSPTSTNSNNSTPTFRLLTNAGTHIYCSAQDSIDRDIWLAALHSGLEITYAGFKDSLSTLSSLSTATVTKINTINTRSQQQEQQQQQQQKQEEDITIITSTSSKILEPTIITPPIPQSTYSQLQKFVKRITFHNTPSSSTNNHNHHPSTSHSISSNNPFLNPYDTSNAPISKNHCISCGRYPPEDIVNSYSGTPLSQYGLENVVVQICNPCLIGQGLLRHVLSITGLYVSDAHERVALVKGLDLMNDVLIEIDRNFELEEEENGNNNNNDNDNNENNENNSSEQEEKDESVKKNESMIMKMNQKKQKVDSEILKLIHDPNFAACRHRSRSLDHISKKLTSGEIVTEEFIDKLNEYANDAIVSPTGATGSGSNSTNSVNETIQMKKEALMVAGDMRAAIEMLREHALPKTSTGTGYAIGTSAMKGGTEMLSCTLEFFLDLCEQGELKSLAFFWTQICQIHMQMLPPTDTESLIRIELVEDFLLTVCMRHSVHLALELVWSCLADLEESLGTDNAPSASCRRRRFAMLRFVCELESLIFDMDNGWGGGSVCLRGMLTPSNQQVKAIKDAMEVLQLHRRFGSHHLTRSARLDKLRSEAQERSGRKVLDSNREEAVMDEAERKYKIARNAEYFSTQLMFCRRLGDIAERLFHMDVDMRKDALKDDLAMLNASGRLGGDPLNKICDGSSGLVNVMHIPSTEGHVFRSKERTPVLLLMEIMSDQKIFETTPNSPKKTQSGNDLIDVSEPIANNTDDTNTKSFNADVNIEDTKIDIDTLENELAQEVDLLGLSDSSSCPPSPSASPGVLQSPKLTLDGSTETKVVSDMVANVVHEQLKQAPLPLPDLDQNESNDSFLSCNSEQNTIESKNENDEVDHSESDIKEGTVDENTVDNDNVEAAVETNELEGDDVDPLQKGIEETQNLEKNEDEDGDIDLLQMDVEETKNLEQKDTKMEDADLLQMNVEEPKQSEQSSGDERTMKGVEDKSEVIEPISEQSPEQPKVHVSGEGDANDVISDNVKEDSKEMPVDHQKDPQIQSNGRNFKLTRKVSAFGSFKNFASGSKTRAGDFISNFGVNGEGRRQVLNTIFDKGRKSSNLIARGVAPAARRAVQAMDRKRAQILMNRGGNSEDANKTDDDEKDYFNMLDPPALQEAASHDIRPSEEDECIEAIRLLLVQNRVAIGKLSPEKAAIAMKREPLDIKRHGGDGEDYGDAGSVDERLAGCGQVSNAILSAIKLWKDGMVSNGELLELIQKDLQFTKVTLPGSENETILIEDSAFWGRFAFGERWAEKKSRIQSSSTFGAQPGWDLTGVIVKANDDLRQEAFAMQLIELSKEAFEMAGLELWIHPYRILATGRTTGIIEMVRNAMSFDSLKKRPGYSEGGLLGHFKKMAEHAADPTEALLTAKRNFIRSLAAYSLLSHFFLFKDRHNGNLLLDTAGHVIHIDFGFIFGIAPGGSFSLESSVPFKLTEEMIEVMDGLGSVLFSEFVTLFCCGFLALQAHCETFVTIVQITSEGSTFKCFEGKDIQEIVLKLRERFCPDLNKEATIAHAMELIRQATNASGTKQYDFFQYLSQGIAA